MEKTFLVGFMEIIKWMVSGLALLGAFLVANQNVWGYNIWIITNTYFCVQSYKSEQYPMAALFFAYLLMAIYGKFKLDRQCKADLL